MKLGRLLKSKEVKSGLCLDDFQFEKKAMKSVEEEMVRLSEKGNGEGRNRLGMSRRQW